MTHPWSASTCSRQSSRTAVGVAGSRADHLLTRQLQSWSISAGGIHQSRARAACQLRIKDDDPATPSLGYNTCYVTDRSPELVWVTVLSANTCRVNHRVPRSAQSVAMRARHLSVTHQRWWPATPSLGYNTCYVTDRSPEGLRHYLKCLHLFTSIIAYRGRRSR